MTVSIIIPNFNGAELLKKNLPHVLQTSANEIIVIDDGSSDQSKVALRDFSDGIKVIVNEKNLGYGRTVCRGVKEAQGDICIFLNTDTRPDPNFITPLLPHFQNSNIFAVSCHEPNRSWATGAFQDGFFHHEPGHAVDTPHISLYASGGSAAFSRQKFIDLGLYDPLFHPFYWEDTDISYRAWKRGWEIWWEPKSIVAHETSSTIRSYFSKSFIDYIAQRNELIFTWKNITDKSLLSEHKKALKDRIFRHPGYLKPFLGALKNFSEIQSRRKIEKSQSTRTDQEIFSLFN